MQIACAKFACKFRKNCFHLCEVLRGIPHFLRIESNLNCAQFISFARKNIYLLPQICFRASPSASIQEFSRTNQLFQYISSINIEDQLNSRFAYGMVRFKIFLHNNLTNKIVALKQIFKFRRQGLKNTTIFCVILHLQVNVQSSLRLQGAADLLACIIVFISYCGIASKYNCV